MQTASPKFLGCLSSSQTHTLYAVLLLSISLLTLSDLPSSTALLFEHEAGEEEDDDLLNSRTVLDLAIVFLRLLAQSALVSSLVSLTGTILTRASLQVPLKAQAMVNLLLSAFGTVVLGTLALSTSLKTAASHELCQFAMRSDSLASLSRTPDYHSPPPSAGGPSFASQSLASLLWPTPATIVGENCDERAAQLLLPALLSLSLCNLFHLHLLYVLFSNSLDQIASPALLPIHLPPKNTPAQQPLLEKHLIIL